MAFRRGWMEKRRSMIGMIGMTMTVIHLRAINAHSTHANFRQPLFRPPSPFWERNVWNAFPISRCSDRAHRIPIIIQPWWLLVWSRSGWVGAPPQRKGNAAFWIERDQSDEWGRPRIDSPSMPASRPIHLKRGHLARRSCRSYPTVKQKRLLITQEPFEPASSAAEIQFITD